MIHPTAIISNHCEIANNVEIGPYVVIRGSVKIDEGTKIGPCAMIGCDTGVVEIGKNNDIGPHSYIGGPPQDVSYKGEHTKLTIGNNNIIREFVSINIGTHKQDGITIIGNHCMLMAYVHIAHDCALGDRVIIANTTNFAGHVVVHDDVKIGGACNFSQFIRLGQHAYIAGDATVNKDILPFTIAQGKYALSRATNRIGLERAGFSKDEIDNIHKAIRSLLMGGRTLEEAIEKIESECEKDKNISYLLNFISSSEKGLA
ncbi:MAG: acyl-ACP--UDP-N-acetylglucosamine O-acyltransferase, partial [Bdellovibrionales bacterium]|nr:acyl-ACP--UDP-N-acetylglucosamine O-acyltransferase [Bdellovibrionales bacterium]